VKSSDIYIISFTGLAAGTHSFSWELDGKFFEADNYLEISDASIKAACTLQKTSRHMELDFTAKGSITLPCDRCMEPLNVKVKADRKMIVRESDETDSDSDDLVFIGKHDRELDVEGWIREMILLSIPMRNVHPEEQCDSEIIEKLNKLSDDSGLKPLNE